MKRQLLNVVRTCVPAVGMTFVLCWTLAGAVAGPVNAPTHDGHVVAGPAQETVLGIGGFFFKSHDPKRLALWYRQNFGIALVPANYGEMPWRQEAGPTAFEPFPHNSEAFGLHKDWMMNFRVRSLDKMVAQLRAAGVTVTVDPKTYPNGRFASLQDPEGNPIQLWQPAVPAAR